jgi:hypothetical protein
MHDFVSRSEARTRGLTQYFSGTRCKGGHISPRYVCNGGCVSCDNKRPPDPDDPETRGANDFKWTEDIREVLIDEYVNSGDIMQARELVKLSAAAYHRELKANPDFADAIKEATVLAIQTLEDRSIHLAGKGNDKLIIATLKAKLGAQYSERIKIDTTHTVKLSDAELDRRIRRLGGGFIIDGTVTRVEDLPPLPEHPRRIDIARREARIAELTRGEETQDIAQ